MNVKRLLYFLIALLIINLLAMLYLINMKTMKPQRDMSEIKIDNYLNVVTRYDSIDFQLNSDYTARFQYELCQFIAKRSGLTVQHHFENDLETAIRKLEKNVYDVIAQNIPVTTENRNILAFTVPVGQTRQVLVQRKKDDSDSVLFISNQLELAYQTIHVTKNSPAILRLKNLSEEIAEPINIRELYGYSSEQLFNMVANREIDYLATDIDSALKNAGLFKELDFSTNISFTQLQAWALRKNSPVLLDSLNVWITDFKQQKGNL